MIMNLNDDDNVDAAMDNTKFFSNDESSSLSMGSGSDPCAYLAGLFDRSSSFDVDVEKASTLPLSRCNTNLLERARSLSTVRTGSSDEKENDTSDTIRDEILYVRQKASILHRASHILLQQQRDYHKVASYQAYVKEEEERRRNSTNQKLSIWDEAKYFLQCENESPDEIEMMAVDSETIPSTTSPLSDFHTVTASMKSLSAVKQYCQDNRSIPPQPVVSSRSRPSIVERGNVAMPTHTPRNLIDTSTVQHLTSVQYFDTEASVIVPRPLIAINTIDRSTVDHWYSQTSDNFPFKGIIPGNKKNR